LVVAWICITRFSVVVTVQLAAIYFCAVQNNRNQLLLSTKLQQFCLGALTAAAAAAAAAAAKTGPCTTATCSRFDITSVQLLISTNPKKQMLKCSSFSFSVSLLLLPNMCFSGGGGGRGHWTRVVRYVFQFMTWKNVPLPKQKLWTFLYNLLCSAGNTRWCKKCEPCTSPKATRAEQ
jgi:hypothetical protein